MLLFDCHEDKCYNQKIRNAKVKTVSDFYIDPKIYKGRPDEKRSAKEEKVYDLLDELSIEYLRVDHSPADTIEDCKKVEQVIGVQICKNLFLTNRTKTCFYILLMPASKAFKTSVVSKILGTSRLSFASEEYMKEFLDITPGSVSIMGLMNDKDKRVKLAVDRDIAESEYIRCHPCINTSTLKIKKEDIFDKFLPFIQHEAIIIDIDS